MSYEITLSVAFCEASQGWIIMAFDGTVNVPLEDVTGFDVYETKEEAKQMAEYYNHRLDGMNEWGFVEMR